MAQTKQSRKTRSSCPVVARVRPRDCRWYIRRSRCQHDPCEPLGGLVNFRGNCPDNSVHRRPNSTPPRLPTQARNLAPPSTLMTTEHDPIDATTTPLPDRSGGTMVDLCGWPFLITPRGSLLHAGSLTERSPRKSITPTLRSRRGIVRATKAIQSTIESVQNPSL